MILKFIYDRRKALKKFPKSEGRSYSVPMVDLCKKPTDCDKKFDELFTNVVVDNSKKYLGHPDSVLLKNGNILTAYPLGHGRGKILTKISTNGGVSWTEGVKNQPISWENSRETPTLYRLEFTNRADRLILISGVPSWPERKSTGGFNCSISDDEGSTWTEFENFWQHIDKKLNKSIVAMASLTRLKENGKFVDKWMGFFHTCNFGFYNYKSILSFGENGEMIWSKPELYFKCYRDAELAACMCEVEVIRSENGNGDILCLLGRSNGNFAKKLHNSLMSFSYDEGRTWTEPREAPPMLTGERHKADYTSDGRLFVTFRSIERNPVLVEKHKDKLNHDFCSEGYVAWVGKFEDLIEAYNCGKENGYRIKIAHVYLSSSPNQITHFANADTGYCGNVVLTDDTIVTSSYGHFGEKNEDGSLKTYIISKRINLDLVEEFLNSKKM